MPIYEYRCKNCGTKFEKLQSINADIKSVICPECNSPEPEKLFSVFGSGSGTSYQSSGTSCSSSSPFT